VHVVDRIEQPGQRVSGADKKLRDLFHAPLARTTSLSHRPVLPACSPGDLSAGMMPGRRSGSCSDPPFRRAGSDL